MSGKLVTLHYLDVGTLFRDQDALWRICEGGDSDNVLAVRIATWNVNNTLELMFRDHKQTERYNAYNEVSLENGIYTVHR